MNKHLLAAISGALLAASAANAVKAAPPAATQAVAPYAYGSPAFTTFVADSYRQIHAADPQTFYVWMDKDCQRIALGGARPADRPMPGWTALLRQKKAEIDRTTDPAQKTKQEMQDAAWLHKTIKAALPHFSLDEGFEFTNAVRQGERQCVLQATLMAGLMQAMDIDAGVVMVYKNIAGDSSNNGHAATLMKRADGKDVIVDCSEPTPFARHRGLFVADSKTGQYRYVEPVFAGATATIVGYNPDGETQKLATRVAAPLDAAFVRSQIEYYRGERAPGGLLSPHPTDEGLASEARHLRTSVAECPQNPLAEYMLGRVYLKQAKLPNARRQLAKAYTFYARFGRVPQGCRDAMTEARIAQAKL